MTQAFTDRWVDRFHDVYDVTPLAEVPWFTASPGIELMKLVIDGVVKRGDEVVDLGCGPGSDAVFLAVNGMRVTGVDLSETALDRARRLAELAAVEPTFVQGSVLDVPLPDECADVVNDSFVFHNMRDEARTLYVRQVHRLLRPGGLFILNSFSDRMVPGTGPLRITSTDIFESFTPELFECERLDLYRNLPTEARPDQRHWIGLFRKRG